MTFGFSLKSSRHLLEAAKELGLQVVGVSFHIPSSCQDLQEAYTHALSDARCVFDMGVWKKFTSLLKIIFFFIISWNFPWDHFSSQVFNASVQVDLGFNMNILDIGSGFTGSEFQLRQVRFQLALGFLGFPFV